MSAVAHLNGTVLDERIIKVEVDKGFHEGRQYGRGTTGGQVRDEFREEFDEGRGGHSVPLWAGSPRMPQVGIGDTGFVRSAAAPCGATRE